MVSALPGIFVIRVINARQHSPRSVRENCKTINKSRRNKHKSRERGTKKNNNKKRMRRCANCSNTLRVFLLFFFFCVREHQKERVTRASDSDRLYLDLVRANFARTIARPRWQHRRHMRRYLFSQFGFVFCVSVCALRSHFSSRAVYFMRAFDDVDTDVTCGCDSSCPGQRTHTVHTLRAVQFTECRSIKNKSNICQTSATHA